MTQSLMDKFMRCLAGGERAVRLFVKTWHFFRKTTVVVLVGLFVSAVAVAEVKLENSVQKVETFVNESGDVERRLLDADSVVPGDELRYTISFANDGAELIDAGSIVITNPVPEDTEYLDGTAFGAGTVIVYSVDGEDFAAPEDLMVLEGGAKVNASAKQYRSIRWTFQPVLKPGESGHVSFNVRLK